jgi:hAT family C-terminal dimerisation region
MSGTAVESTPPAPRHNEAENAEPVSGSSTDAGGIGFEQDGGDGDERGPTGSLHHRRKRVRGEFPWIYTRDWITGDSRNEIGKRQCQECRKWYSSQTNAQGWKAHLLSKHGIRSPTTSSLNNDDTSSRAQQQQQSLIKKVLLPAHIVRTYENAVVDYVISGDISLRAAGEERFHLFVSTLTNGYTPPSTRTVVRRTVELFSIAQPILARFLCELDVCVSLTMDGWSNRNLKGFYVVTAHWIDTTSGCFKSLLLTILDVSCGTGVGNRVGLALFTYLLDKVGAEFLPKVLHVVTDNGSDACAAVNRLFQLVNSHLGTRRLLSSNHVRCADHSVQRGVLFVLAQVKEINEKLRASLVSIRRGKVLRQSYRTEAERLGYASKEPTHQDSPTRWNSTHEMCRDAVIKREALDQTMLLHQDDLGRGPLTDMEWSKIEGVMNFLRVPRQVMESLAADKKSSMDLVELSIDLLIKHCEINEPVLKSIDASLSTEAMRTKLLFYREKLVQLPALVCGYLNPQIPKPTDPARLASLKTIIRAVLTEGYADKMQGPPPSPDVSDSQSGTPSLFQALFANAGGGAVPQEQSVVNDEVEKYLTIGNVTSQSFLDVVQWWMARKDVLPAHYQMAMDYLGTPATSTPSERVNSMAGREFTTARQSLSSAIFIKTMCLRSWMTARVITIPSDRQKALLAETPASIAVLAGEVGLSATRSASSAVESIDHVVSMIEIEQEDWVEEVLDDGVVSMLNIQFDTMIAEDDSDCLSTAL